LIVEPFRDQLLLILFTLAAAVVRAMGVTIESGQTGLLFSFGRARRELQPGFHLLIPFLQRARRMPTRSRTLDLPSQRVTTFEGLVYHVDANLVYRVIDVRKAMIEIDRLEKGMLQMLGLGVQEVLRGAHHEEIKSSDSLDRALATNLARRLVPWGVEVERAGLPSITPSPRTLRITQLAEVTGERRDKCRTLVQAGVPQRRALALIGTRTFPRSRTRALRRRAEHARRTSRLLGRLKQRGWTAVEARRAELALLARVSARGRSRLALRH